MKKISIIVLLLSSFSNAVTTDTTQGIKHSIHKIKNTDVHVFEIPTDQFLVKPVKALNTGVGRETVSNMAKRTGATLAINGTFFSSFSEYEGIPSGVYKLKDEWLAIGDKSRAALGIKNNQLFWGRLKVSAFAKIGEKVFAIHGINRPPKNQENILYTSSFNQSTLTHTNRVEISVSEGQISHVNHGMDSRIPSNGYVLSLPPQHLPSSFAPGTKAHITYTTESNSEATPWKEMDYIVSGVPLLIQDGKLITDYTAEAALNDFITEKFARTAIGAKTDGTIVVVVASHIPPINQEPLRKMPLGDVGSALLNKGYSRLDIKKMTLDEILLALEKSEDTGQAKGLTVPELGQFMESLGVINAINLSGGKSTNVFFEEKSLPLHGTALKSEEKKISDSIVFLKR